MRPIASTWVASMQNIAAPDSASELMWVKCQSVATPSSAEYWHIGDTMMRFLSFRPRSSIGENRALMRGVPADGGVMRGVYWAGNRMLASREEWRPAAQCIALSHGRKATPNAPRRYSQNPPGSGLP